MSTSSNIVEKETTQDASEIATNQESSRPLINWMKIWMGAHTQWIVKNWHWSKVKPIIRCAVVGWISVVLFVIPRVEKVVGQASFLLLITAFFAPPFEPFISVVEKEILILLFVGIGWAWICLGVFLANLTRAVHNPTATIFMAATGQYVEPAPSVIIAIFVFFGSAFFLYIKATKGPGPYFFAAAFGCLFLDITMATVVIFPFPFYLAGKTFMLPLTIGTALHLLASILIFPSTISAQFTSRLQDVLTPLISALDIHRTILDTPFPDPSSMDTYNKNVKTASSLIKGSEAALSALSAAGRLLKGDLIYCRFAPQDFKAFQFMCRRMSGRTNGLDTFFVLVGTIGMGIGIEKNSPGTPVHTVPNSPLGSPLAGPSRRTSLLRLDDDEGKPHTSPTLVSSFNFKAPSSSSPFPHPHQHQHHRSHSHSQNFLHLPFSRPTTYEKPHRGREVEHAVGAFEYQRYLNLEATRLWDPDKEEWTRKSMKALGESCDSILEVSREGLIAVHAWLGGVRNGRIAYFLGFRRKERDREMAAKITQLKELREKIRGVLETFRSDKRLRILDPYGCKDSTKPKPEVQDPNGGDTIERPFDTNDEETPRHRYLFHSYFYQFHMLQICSIIVEMLDEIIKLEGTRTHAQLWTPVGNLNIFRWNRTFLPESADQTQDDDPDVIQGLQHDLEDDDKSTVSDDLGMPHRRDPDALPPQNSLEWGMALIHNFVTGLGGGNALYAMKASLLTVLLSMPYFFKSSASFAYENKFIWAVFMAQLTISRFQGDTTFGLVSRIGSTFFGSLTGLVVWYMSCGSGRGNPYGLAAVCAVFFPFFYFARLYAPVQPVTNAICFVTFALIIGYSYQDFYFPLPGTPGFGWTIAWRRFVLVTAGVTAAFLASFLPPTTTIRKYHRTLLSTTSAQLGAVYCAILSFANTKSEPEIQEIISCLLAVRAKLNRSFFIRTNIAYEFSLRGRWPTERYNRIVELQIAISYSLSNLICVLEHLESSWARAFLRRTRFMDPDFQGDVLAVISMISFSLRTGTPLPQITPCPLLDRFLLQYHGLNVIHKAAADDYGLPRSMTLDTLKNEQYLMFSVGVTTATRIITRLDQLMLATKEVVGEHYHIHGVGAASAIHTSFKDGTTGAVV